MYCISIPEKICLTKTVSKNRLYLKQRNSSNCKQNFRGSKILILNPVVTIYMCREILHGVRFTNQRSIIFIKSNCVQVYIYFVHFSDFRIQKCIGAFLQIFRFSSPWCFRFGTGSHVDIQANFHQVQCLNLIKLISNINVSYLNKNGNILNGFHPIIVEQKYLKKTKHI